MTQCILVVDNTPLNVKLLKNILTVKGYEVTTATSGQESLDKIRSGSIDLVLLDVMMPSMNSYEVCRAIRKHPRSALLPVVMGTALDAKQVRVNSLSAGPTTFSQNQ